MIQRFYVKKVSSLLTEDAYSKVLNEAPAGWKLRLDPIGAMLLAVLESPPSGSVESTHLAVQKAGWK